MITKQKALEIYDNPEWRLNHCYKIKTKDRRIITLKANKAQEHYRKNRSGRDIILKARQLGFSTEKLIEQLDDTITHKNTTSAIIAHKRNKVQKLFEIVKLAYNRLPEQIKPEASFDNKNELYFPKLDSKIYVTTDTRSATVHNLHISEFAFMRNPEDVLLAALESVPKDGKISIESTANGMTGPMYDIWTDPHSEFKKHFYDWTWDVSYRLKTDKIFEELLFEYRPLAKAYELIPNIEEVLKIDKEQLAFYIAKVRRHKVKVKQEYPCTDKEAFIASGRNVFKDSILQKHQAKRPIEIKWGYLKIWEKPLDGFKYVMGVDTSEGLGQDNAVIQILNAHTGEQAAELADNNISAGELSRIAIQIGRYYNHALIVPEINSSGISFLDGIKKVYYNIYKREQLDKRTGKSKKSLGWRTTGRTKPRLVDDLVGALDDRDIQINLSKTLDELKVFVRTDETGKQGYGAEGNKKDDRVIALGLAFQGIKDIPYLKTPKSQAQEKLEEYIKNRSEYTSDNYYKNKGKKQAIRRKYGLKKY